MFRRWPPQLVLLVTFASFYFVIGPGNYFSVDEVMEEETAQALILRRTLDIPAVPDTLPGRGQSYYTREASGLPFVSLPFVYLGLKLDDAMGSMNGGVLAGPPIGPEQQPLRWGGRLAISASLMVNAIAGGAIVAVLFMVGAQLSPNPRASLLMAIAAGLGTLIMSEATHFYQHEMDALMVILAFWFFSEREAGDLDKRSLFGGLSLGVAMLVRPDAAPAAVVLWIYGVAAAWKLVQHFPDRWPRMIRRTLLAAAGPLGAVAGSTYFNYLRFGWAIRFGMVGERERDRLVIDLTQIAHALAGYLISPSLSIFLFAPPLILALAVGRRAYRRWPLQTATLILAAVAHLLLVALFRSWHGDLSYGPRYMLEAIVLLMPLTLPAFESAAELASRWGAIAVTATVSLGFVVQLIGVAVYVDAIDVKRMAAGIVADGAWVFVPRASPIIYDLEEIVARRSLSPWAIRSLAIPGPALLLLIVLFVIVWFGGRRVLRCLRAPQEERANLASGALSTAIVAAAVVPILIGFAMARPLIKAPDRHALELFNAGLAEQQAGHAVSAEEDYAMVLSLYPSNENTRFNLGVLEQSAGRINEAMSFYQGVLQQDPNFTPAKLNKEYILRSLPGPADLHPR
jgi:hypothetical protein